MKLQVFIVSLLYFIFAVSTLSAQNDADTNKLNGYDVIRGPFSVGQGFIGITKLGDKTKVNYRMHIDVKVLGMQVYFLDSEQVALFDKAQKLIYARTSADIDGKKHDVAIDSDGANYKVSHNGVEKTFSSSDFVATTLNPTFATPQTGVWLDLTDTNLVKYEVEEKSNYFQLRRPDGEDKLYHDGDRIMEKIISSLSIGSLTLKRVKEGEDALAFKPSKNRVDDVIPEQYLE